ncbi:hypothetical protein ABZ372_45435 [Streptomyces sp. NPDC005921]
MVIVPAAVLERCLSLFGGPQTYILCADFGELSERLDRESSTNRWFLLAGLVVSVAALVNPANATPLPPVVPEEGDLRTAVGNIART